MRHRIPEIWSGRMAIGESSRRGFLIADLLSGIAIAGLALALAATMLRTDIQIRRAREEKFRMLVRFENVMARAEATDPAKLSEESVQAILDDLGRKELDTPAVVSVSVTDVAGKPAGKRVVLRAKLSDSKTGSMFLMRDFYGRGDKR